MVFSLLLSYTITDLLIIFTNLSVIFTFLVISVIILSSFYREFSLRNSLSKIYNYNTNIESKSCRSSQNAQKTKWHVI
jgi:hypothetical protein